MRRSLFIAAGLGLAIATSEVRGDPGTLRAIDDTDPARPTPRPVTVEAVWTAPADAEQYSEGRVSSAELRFGERLYITRVCVSDARKLTMISYRDAVGHTDVPLALGDRGVGRVDPSDRDCTLFDDVEVTRVEKCKCRFQCAGERHQCTISGVVRRP